MKSSELSQPLLANNDAGQAQAKQEEIVKVGKGPLLGRIDNLRTAQDFLEECSYFIHLSDLYDVKSSCYYHEDMTFCPVLVEIKKKAIQELIGARYLLQVWEKGGKKVFEKALNGEVTKWAISYKYLLFKPSADDENSDYWHVVSFKESKEKIFLIKDFAPDPSYKHATYAEKKIYLANDSTIQVGEINVNDELVGKKQDEIKVLTIDMAPYNQKISGLFMDIYPERKTDINGEYIIDKATGKAKRTNKKLVIVALETGDHQLDFNKIEFKKPVNVGSINTESEAQIKLVQYRELIPRREKLLKVDHIQTISVVFKMVQKKAYLVAGAKRESGEFDFYYDAQRVFSSSQEAENNPLIRSIELTFDHFYISMSQDWFSAKEVRKIKAAKEAKKSKKGKKLAEKKVDLNSEEEKKLILYKVGKKKDRVRSIDLKWTKDLCYENSEYLPKVKLEKTHFWMIKDSCKLFNSYCLIGTVLLVAHGKCISLFSILTEVWINHFIYERNIKEMLRGSDGNEIVILFDDNSIKVVRQHKIVNTGEEYEPWVDEEKFERRELCSEELIDYHQDRQNSQWIIFVTNRSESTENSDQDYGIWAYYDHNLFDISKQIKNQFDEEELIFHTEPHIVFLFSASDITEFIIQTGHIIELFTIEYKEVLILEEQNQIEETQNSAAFGEENKERLTEEEKKPKYETKPIITRIDTFNVGKKDAQGNQTTKSLIKMKICDGAKIDLNKNQNSSEISDSKNQENKKQRFCLLLHDTLHFYKINCQNQELKKIDNQNSVGWYLADNNYLYTLSKISRSRRQGFRLYDLANVVNTEIDHSYLLTNKVFVGCQGNIGFSSKNQRLIYQQSFDDLMVIPLLHRNTMTYIGMKPRSNFLASKVKDGKIITLSVKGKLYCWDMITGKQFIDNSKKKLSKEEKANSNPYKKYKDYEVYAWKDEDQPQADTVYKREWYGKILLKKRDRPGKEKMKAIKEENAVKKIIPFQVNYAEQIKTKYFEFCLIEIKSETEIKEHLQFMHKILPGTGFHYLIFSDNLEYMYERMKYERHYMYKRTKYDPKTGSCQWQVIHRFYNLPYALLNLTQYPFIFTTDFTRYIDLDETRTEFIIRSTFDQEKVLVKIPSQLMDGKKDKIEQIARRFKWVNKDIIHIINQQGIERLIKIDVEKKEFKEIEFNFIPLYDQEYCKRAHYMWDPPSYSLAESFETYKKRYQHYKSSLYLERALTPDYNMINEIFQVDYRIDGCKGPFETDMSFSFLHWSLIEQLKSGKTTVDQIDAEQAEMLFYNILPRGSTMLHKIHENGNLMESLLNIAHPNQDDRSVPKIHIPLLPNFAGKSVLHLCVEKEEFRYINVLLEYLSGYDIDHHSRAIVEVLPICIEKGFPNFIPYLQSRIKQTEQIKEITKGMLKETNTHGMCSTSLWIGKDAIDELFQVAPIEQDVRLQFVDIPQFHKLDSKISEEFFAALSGSEDMTLFETTAVKKVIEYEWPIVLKYSLLKLFVPFVIFQIAYMYFMQVIFKSDDIVYAPVEYATVGTLALFALYLLKNEIYQLSESGLDYFKSIWNYLDIVPPIGVLIFLVLHYYIDFFNIIDPETKFVKHYILEIEAQMQATMSLFIWLKFLYFLRIFESTGYLIRIIIQVCIDMRFFLALLLLTFVAFGNAIYNINKANLESDRFVDGGGFFASIAYVYEMVLGAFNTEEFGTVAVGYMWGLFLLCTVLNMIIMMNLLIAIISESFANINSVSKQASYQEKARIISENMFLVPQNKKAAYTPANTYLLMAIDTEQELQENSVSIDQKLKEVSLKFQEQNEKNYAKLLKIEEQTEKIYNLIGGNSLSNLGSKIGGSKFGGSNYGGAH